VAKFNRRHHFTRIGGCSPASAIAAENGSKVSGGTGHHRMIYTLPELLFREGDLYPIMEHQKAKMLKEIESLDKSMVLDNDLDSLAAIFAEKYNGGVPVLREAEKEAEHDEVEIDVSKDPRRMAYYDDDGPVYIKATRLKVWIPFDGDAIFFRIRPSTYNFSPPRGEIRGSSIACVIVDDNLTQELLDRSFNEWLRDVNQHLTWHRESLGNFNSNLI
jgi:hypothetical protein